MSAIKQQPPRTHHYPPLFVILALGAILFLGAAAITYQTASRYLFEGMHHRACLLIQHSLTPEMRHDMQRFYNDKGYAQRDSYIAHGGGIAPFTYTNCREAVLASLAQGFRFIEIDLLETTDGHLIGAHCWQDLYSHANLSAPPAPLSWEQAKKLKIHGQYHVLSGPDIADIMRAHPEMVLVTDKIENFPLLLEEIPFPDRMIVEVFSEQSYLYALRCGVRYPALCINAGKLQQAQQLGLPIVTMGTYGVEWTAGQVAAIRQLHRSGTCIMLFGTSDRDFDSPDFVKEHLGRTVSKIYTDRWTPQCMPHEDAHL